MSNRRKQSAHVEKEFSPEEHRARSGVTLQKQDVVWAKIRGYPWWPAMVGGFLDDDSESVTEIADLDAPDFAGHKVLVNFIGQNSHAQLPIDKVLPFETHLSEFKNSKKKDLVESIQIAQKILRGEMTYQEHRQSNKSKSFPRRDPKLPTRRQPSRINSAAYMSSAAQESIVATPSAREDARREKSKVTDFLKSHEPHVEPHSKENNPPEQEDPPESSQEQMEDDEDRKSEQEESQNSQGKDKQDAKGSDRESMLGKRSKPSQSSKDKIKRFLQCEALGEPVTKKRPRTEINSNLSEQLELGPKARNNPGVRKDKRPVLQKGKRLNAKKESESVGQPDGQMNEAIRLKKVAQKLSSLIALKRSQFLSQKPTMLKNLLILFKSEINPIVLYESRAGKHLYAFYSHCNSLVNECHTELIEVVTKAYHVLYKWYNHIREVFFDIQSDFNILSPDTEIPSILCEQNPINVFGAPIYPRSVQDDHWDFGENTPRFAPPLPGPYYYPGPYIYNGQDESRGPHNLIRPKPTIKPVTSSRIPHMEPLQNMPPYYLEHSLQEEIRKKNVVHLEESDVSSRRPSLDEKAEKGDLSQRRLLEIEQRSPIKSIMANLVEGKEIEDIVQNLLHREGDDERRQKTEDTMTTANSPLRSSTVEKFVEVMKSITREEQEKCREYAETLETTVFRVGGTNYKDKTQRLLKLFRVRAADNQEKLLSVSELVTQSAINGYEKQI